MFRIELSYEFGFHPNLSPHRGGEKGSAFPAVNCQSFIVNCVRA